MAHSRGRRLVVLLSFGLLSYRFVYPRRWPDLGWARIALILALTPVRSAWAWAARPENASGVQAVAAALALVGLFLNVRYAREARDLERAQQRAQTSPRLLARLQASDGSSDPTLSLLNVGGGAAFDLHIRVEGRLNFTDAIGNEKWIRLVDVRRATLLPNAQERIESSVVVPSNVNILRVEVKGTDTIDRVHDGFMYAGRAPERSAFREGTLVGDWAVGEWRVGVRQRASRSSWITRVGALVLYEGARAEFLIEESLARFFTVRGSKEVPRPHSVASDAPPPDPEQPSSTRLT